MATTLKLLTGCSSLAVASRHRAEPCTTPSLSFRSPVLVRAPVTQWTCSRREGVRVKDAAATSPSPASTFSEALVEEIMSPHPVLLKVGTSCKEAARALLANDCSSAAVVDGNGRLLGVLSESDLLWKGAGAPLDHTIIPPVFVGAFDLLISLRDNAQIQHELDKILARTVEQAMSKDPVVIRPEATLSEAAKTLLANKVHSLPVVDGSGRVVGILSQHDALRGMVAQQLPLL